MSSLAEIKLRFDSCFCFGSWYATERATMHDLNSTRRLVHQLKNAPAIEPLPFSQEAGGSGLFIPFVCTQLNLSFGMSGKSLKVVNVANFSTPRIFGTSL